MRNKKKKKKHFIDKETNIKLEIKEERKFCRMGCSKL